MAQHSAREAGELLDLTHLEVIRRIRRGEIKAKKVGWFWLIDTREVEAVKQREWYKRLMRLRAERNQN